MKVLDRSSLKAERVAMALPVVRLAGPHEAAKPAHADSVCHAGAGRTPARKCHTWTLAHIEPKAHKDASTGQSDTRYELMYEEFLFKPANKMPMTRWPSD